MFERKFRIYHSFFFFFPAKKIQISFITTIQFIKLFSEVFTFNYVHITGNKTFSTNILQGDCY